MIRRRIMAAEQTTVRVLTRPTSYFPDQSADRFGPSFYSEVHQEFGGVIPFLARMIKTVILSIFLLVISIVSYGLLYMAVMPTYSAIVPLFFDYTGTSAPSPSPPQPRQQRLSSRQQNIGDKPDQHVHLPTPWARVDLFARHSPWECGMVEDVVPQPLAQDRLLVSRQAYFVEALLDLPESQANRRAGTFGVTVELTAANGTVLAVSHRSARLPHQSVWIRTLQKIMTLAPLVLGAWEESRTVPIASFRQFVESKSHPAVSLCEPFGHGVQLGQIS
jgi:hypothetical protein